MSIPKVPHSDSIDIASHRHHKVSAKAVAAAGVNKDQFNKVLNNIASAIISPEEMRKKQRLNKDKQEQIEDGQNLQPEDDELQLIKKVNRIKKKLKDLAKFERHQLGL